jgi:hypothetical protein
MPPHLLLLNFPTTCRQKSPRSKFKVEKQTDHYPSPENIPFDVLLTRLFGTNASRKLKIPLAFAKRKGNGKRGLNT